MIGPYKLDPDSWYDENALFLAGFSPSVLAHARRAGKVRGVPAGRNGRILYRGRWVIDWLTSSGSCPVSIADGRRIVVRADDEDARYGEGT